MPLILAPPCATFLLRRVAGDKERFLLPAIVDRLDDVVFRRETDRERVREGGCRAIRKDERNGRRKLKSSRREKRDYDRNDDEGRTSDCLSVNFILYTEKLT